jgi:hypothetical protein
MYLILFRSVLCLTGQRQADLHSFVHLTVARQCIATAVKWTEECNISLMVAN